MKDRKFIQDLTTNIRDSEIKLSTSRSTGPWWQHTNKNETKVTLDRDIHTTKFLDMQEVAVLTHKHKNIITKNGHLKLDSQKYRSQPRNKQDLQEKFCKILASIFVQHKQRILRKKVPQKEKERRMDDKKRKSFIKKMRKKDVD